MFVYRYTFFTKRTGLCFRFRTVQYRNVLSPNLAVTLDIAGPSNIGGDTG